jgi:hypothetical protein
MELLQVLNRNLPSKHKILTLCHKKNPKDISEFLLQIIKNIKKNTTDIKTINLFCIQVYDMIYYDIIFDKVKISKKILRILEELALPIKYIGEEKRKENLQKIKMIKI